MRRPATLFAFSEEERKRAHALLGTLVASMMGRKLEEEDWAEVYCKAKNIPLRGWSNLDIDVVNENLGVEHKMLKRKSNVDLIGFCGETLMHPSATRSIRVPPADADPESAMVDILTQYAELIEARREKVREQSEIDNEPDMRTGWLLWQDSLRQFLYFEEEMIAPDPADYFAEWHSRRGGGGRKPSTSLWIYEKDTGKKRYSVTTEAGAKIQPYFDVPPPNDPNLYLFTVIGEVIEAGLVRVWISEATARELERLLGELNIETISRSIGEAAAAISKTEEGVLVTATEPAREVFVAESAYEALRNTIPGVSDEHSFQLLAQYLRTRS
ncbi:MAG: hypothetical protein ACRDSJ_16085 [Rubrobacteraceae bacterium]